jgi:hypothetical protein
MTYATASRSSSIETLSPTVMACSASRRPCRRSRRHLCRNRPGKKRQPNMDQAADKVVSRSAARRRPSRGGKLPACGAWRQASHGPCHRHATPRVSEATKEIEAMRASELWDKVRSFFYMMRGGRARR